MEVEGTMKVQNTTIFMGDNTRRERQNGVTEEKTGQKTIFAGNFNKKFDPIAQKKQQARDQAMKIVRDAWAGEQELDADLEEKRSKIREYQTSMSEASSKLKEIDENRQALKDSYGVSDDSKEEQDLKLLEKEMDAQKAGSGMQLTEEEEARIKEIKEKGLTEYQQRSLELKESRGTYEEQLTQARAGAKAENSAIMTMKINRLKSQTMIKASQSADEVLEAAGQEIIGMLIDEAKDHIDEEMEEKKEAAEKKAEKEEEEEEKIEKIKEDKAEKEEFSEGVAEQVEDISQYMVEMDSTMNEVQQEIKKIMDEMKLLEEDLKGAEVDTTC